MSKIKLFVFALIALMFLAAVSAVPVSAQDGWDPLRIYITRDALQDLLGRLEGTAQSSAYSGTLRQRAQFEAELIRTRLRDGDFQVGDRILLEVEREPTLTDTFTVALDRIVDLPEIGNVELAGLLRSELEPHLTEFIGRFLRDPGVRARSLIPVTITGAVGRPGFYTVPSELLLQDALMIAGGPTADARINEIRIDRGNDRIWEGDRLQEAITAGQTLDQLSLVAGDQIDVPARGAGLAGSYGTFYVLGFILAIPATIAGMIALF